MSENTGSKCATSGTVWYKRHGRILTSSRRGRRVIYEYLITGGDGPSHSGETTSQFWELARNGIVGPVMPQRPAGVMTKYTGFCRARETRRTQRECAARVKDNPNGPRISATVYIHTVSRRY